MKRLDACLDRLVPLAFALAIGAALAWGVRGRWMTRVMDFYDGRK